MPNRRSPLGLLWGVTAAMVTFHVVTLLVSIATGATGIAIETMGFLRFALLWGVFGIFYWTTGLIATMPFFLAIIYVGQVFTLRGIVYYWCAGVLGGILVTPVFVLIDPPIYWVPWEVPTFLDKCLTTWPWSMVAGISGGTAIWWFYGRFIEPRAGTPPVP
ncbi:hypothetical protein [Microvirga pudoricolor]|uniref:hypothetical protein n=1 Tax=Microvirga pudoricolor TaxID=2778729 RepID=UPI00194E47E8|nr:hypothetical protein [Microvirga pudoricolor]MBM6594133.1 hypothetical protein [Microvirga pudoricolor]